MTGTKSQQQKSLPADRTSVDESLSTGPSIPLTMETRRLLAITEANSGSYEAAAAEFLNENARLDRVLAA